MQLQAALGDIQLDLIAIADESEWSAEGGFRRDMQHNCAVRGAAHARVGDAQHIANALLEQLPRDRQVADFGHARTADGTAVLQDQDMGWRRIKRWIMDARLEVGDIFEDQRGTAVITEGGTGGGMLDDRAIGSEVAAEDAQAAFRLQRVIQRADDIRVRDSGRFEVLRH